MRQQEEADPELERAIEDAARASQAVVAMTNSLLVMATEEDLKMSITYFRRRLAATRQILKTEEVLLANVEAELDRRTQAGG